MADAPWRCSQCGTVNEPVANACRTCGRWPSLFELEGSTIEAEPAETRASVEVYEPDLLESDYAEPEVYDEGPLLDVDIDVDLDHVDDDATEQPKPLWRRLTSLVIPLGVVLYIVISALVNSDG